MGRCPFAHPYPFSHACCGDAPTCARKRRQRRPGRPPFDPAASECTVTSACAMRFLIIGSSMRRVLRGDSIGCDRRTARTRGNLGTPPAPVLLSFFADGDERQLVCQLVNSRTCRGALGKRWADPRHSCFACISSRNRSRSLSSPPSPSTPRRSSGRRRFGLRLPRTGLSGSPADADGPVIGSKCGV
jgi:hypothetical protein